MRKQVDFVVRVFKLGNGNEGTYTSEMLNQYTHKNYLDNGYEVHSANVAQIFANEIFFNMNFVKYDDVDDEVDMPSPEVEVKAVGGK